MSQKDVVAMLEYLNRERARHEALSHHQYDGVLGTLPEWFGEQDREEFLRIRNSLIDEYFPFYETREIDPQQVNTKIAAAIKAWVLDYINPSDKSIWPEKHEAQIARLAQLYVAYQRGQSGGEKFLYGHLHSRTLAAGRREAKFRQQAGEARAGKYGPVRQMLIALKPSSFDDLLAKLKAAEGDDFGLRELRRFVVQEVDEKGETVSYLWDDREQEPFTFKTLKNYLADLK